MMISISDDLRWRSSWSPDFGTLTSSFEVTVRWSPDDFPWFSHGHQRGPVGRCCSLQFRGWAVGERGDAGAWCWKPIRFFHSDCLIAWLWPSNR
jgi:hypothetical protein